jgi:hypothetical protein
LNALRGEWPDRSKLKSEEFVTKTRFLIPSFFREAEVALAEPEPR